MTVVNYTGWQYLLIDLANNNGLDSDKEVFEERIKWAEDNLDSLELFAANDNWKEKPLFIKATQAIRKAQQGKPTGHLMGLDAVNSGMQIMSVVTGCMSGAEATGLVNPNERADAYTKCTQLMNGILNSVVSIKRKLVKTAVMTFLYGSKKEPEALFGEDTPELHGFHKAMYKLAPGACDLLEALVSSWNPNGLAHSWQLPDGADVQISVMKQQQTRIEVDELDHSTFTYTYDENMTTKRGVKNAANVIHSLDAYVLRNLVRRCSHDARWTQKWLHEIEATVLERHIGVASVKAKDGNEPVLLERYESSLMADMVILDTMVPEDLDYLSDSHLKKLASILSSMLTHDRFSIVTVHDDFRAHPNNMNSVRMHYRNILAELADSEVLSDLLSQLYMQPITVTKLSSNLSSYIRNSNYGLC